MPSALWTGTTSRPSESALAATRFNFLRRTGLEKLRGKAWNEEERGLGLERERRDGGVGDMAAMSVAPVIGFGNPPTPLMVEFSDASDGFVED